MPKSVHCPFCQSETAVLDTRVLKDGAVRHRRRCKQNGHRYTTYETVSGLEQKRTQDVREQLGLIEGIVKHIKGLLE